MDSLINKNKLSQIFIHNNSNSNHRLNYLNQLKPNSNKFNRDLLNLQLILCSVQNIRQAILNLVPNNNNNHNQELLNNNNNNSNSNHLHTERLIKSLIKLLRIPHSNKACKMLLQLVQNKLSEIMQSVKLQEIWQEKPYRMKVCRML